MKLIIAGSRHLKEFEVYGKLVELRISDHPMVQATEIVSGKAAGADTAGEDYADFYDIPVKAFPPDYDTYPGRAPLVRNSKMAAYADALLLIWNGSSNGSADMKRKMQDLGKPVYEIIVSD